MLKPVTQYPAYFLSLFLYQCLNSGAGREYIHMFYFFCRFT